MFSIIAAIVQLIVRVIFRQPDFADRPKPTGGEGLSTRDVSGDSGGAATHEGGGPLWPSGQDETV